MKHYTVLLFLFLALLAGCQQTEPEDADVLSSPWEDIVTQAQGTTVNMIMWMGDPYINAYMNDFVKPGLKEKYGIDLNIGSGQGNQIVSMLMTEIEAGKSTSEVDMVWINGETFYQLRQIQALFGPFTDHLPNSQYIDFDNPYIGIDFQQPVAGYESPWGNVQFSIIYDTTRVASPPRNKEELKAWVQTNPGKFTFDTAFTGMTFLKCLLFDFSGDPSAFDGSFNEEVYQKYSNQLWQYINEIKPYFWKEGKTFPTGVAPLHQMFGNGEVDFTMSYNDGEIDNKILQGVFPKSSSAFALETGTIQNSHYLGIVKNASNKAGALVTINFLISPEAQYEKSLPGTWGDGTVLAIDRLPVDWQDRFKETRGKIYAPERSEMQTISVGELAPEYMIRLYDDFRKYVLNE